MLTGELIDERHGPHAQLFLGVDGFTLRLWNGVLGISYEHRVADLARIEKEISNPKIHTYLAMYRKITMRKSISQLTVYRNNVYGQKTAWFFWA